MTITTATTTTIYEIRNYLLKPGMLEHFIDYFEAHFIITQEAVKMHVIGQFRVIDQPDHFVWLRGFSDMQTRLEGLQNFYGGEVWKKYGPLANAMMLDSDHVHLLRPLDAKSDVARGITADSVAADLAEGVISPNTGLVVVDFYRAAAGKRDGLVEQFQSQVLPVYQDAEIDVRGYFIAEMSENTFPRLPVIQNEGDFVVITTYAGKIDYQEKQLKVTGSRDFALGGLLSVSPETLLLTPTLRSALRG